MFEKFKDWLSDQGEQGDRLFDDDEDLYIKTYSQEHFESKYATTELIDSYFDGPTPL